MEPRFAIHPRRWFRWKLIRFCWRFHLWWLPPLLGIGSYMKHADDSALILALHEVLPSFLALPADLRVAVERTLDELSEKRLVGDPVKVAVRAPDIYLVLEPSARYEELLAALRTGDLDAVASFAHG